MTIVVEAGHILHCPPTITTTTMETEAEEGNESLARPFPPLLLLVLLVLPLLGGPGLHQLFLLETMMKKMEATTKG